MLVKGRLKLVHPVENSARGRLKMVHPAENLEMFTAKITKRGGTHSKARSDSANRFTEQLV